MRVQLLALLADRDIIHPTRITSIVWTADELRMAITGHRWWGRTDDGHGHEGAIDLIFRGMSEGVIRPDELELRDDEALDDFQILPIAEAPWALPSDGSIYCSEPIPDPLRLYVRLDDYLASQNAFKGPVDFLNQGDRISSFARLALCNGFHLGGGPECVRALLCDELEHQGVRYTAVPTPAPASCGFLVRLGDSAFVCREAEANLDPRA